MFFYLKHTFLIFLGCFLAALTFIIVADLPESGSPLSERLLVGGIFTFLMLLAFSPMFELVRSKLTGSKQSLWSEITDMLSARVAAEMVKLAGKSPAFRKMARIKAIIKISIFCLYIIGAHFFTKNNIYENSDNLNIFLWAIIFPGLTLIFLYGMLKQKYEKHVKLLSVLIMFLAAFMVTPLIFYFDIVINKVEGNQRFERVTIESVNLSACSGRGTCLCDEKISILDQNNKLHGLCLEHVSFGTLVNGDVAYIDDGDAKIELIENEFGSYVKSIEWNRKYTSNDREWSVEDQKYHYFNNQ